MAGELTSYWLARGRGVVQDGGVLLPYNVRAAAIGDSLVAALATSTSPVWYNTLSSILDWANVLSGSRLFVVQGGNKGVGGQSSGVIAGRYSDDLEPLAAQFVFADGGINDDPATVTAAQILANVDVEIAKATALGQILIYLPILPASNASAGEITRRGLVNAGLMSRTSATFRVIDTTGYDLNTMTYAENGAFGPAGVRIHPNVVGARFLGARLAAIIMSIVGAGSPILAPTDPLNLFPYGAMAGTTGSFDAAGTGQIASNFQIYTSTAGGATVNANKIPDLGGEWQEFIISGSYTGNGKSVQLTAGFDFAGGAPDAQYETTLEVQVSGAVNVDAVSAITYLYNTGYNNPQTFASLFQNNIANNSGGYDVPDFSGPLRVMPVSLPGEAPLHGRVFITAYLREGGAASPCAATVRVRKIGFKKLTPLAPGKMAAPAVAAMPSSLSVARAANPPANGAAITGYDITYSADGVNWTTVAMTTNPQTITGLTDGQSYQVATIAKNSAGSGPRGFTASGTPQWTPAALFANGEDGAWYDFSDLSTMFQDTAGTIAVTAAGQPVGKIIDKSGKGRHWTAADNGTKRPTYGGTGSNPRYISFDGADDEGEATGISGGILHVVMAPYMATAAGGYCVAARFGAAADNLGLQRNNLASNWRTDGPATLNFNTSGMRINGVATRSFVLDAANVLNMQKTGTGSATVIHLGNNSPGVDRFTGRFYGALIVLSRVLTAGEVTLVENYIASKAGVTI